MMIDKRLIAVAGDARRHVAANVAFQWVALVANIAAMGAVALLLQGLYERTATAASLWGTVAAVAAAAVVRLLCTAASSRQSHLSSAEVKLRLRDLIYRKLLALGPRYRSVAPTSEVVQVAVEGVDQLETYFGAYLPQFFYAMLAPVTLFAVLCFVNVPAAAVLLACVPLIPAAIAAVQTWAKRLLGTYWGRYTSLGDTFLENLQGLTTLKVYRADAFKQREMNEEAERFRRVTMRVLTMQLNSITIMDLVAFCGAAAGTWVAVTQFQAGAVGLPGVLFTVLVAADFFIPMRQLGSFFHIAMNGMAASEKIFRLLDADVPADGSLPVPDEGPIVARGLSFTYPGAEGPTLRDLDIEVPRGSFTAVVGESGSGKSTLASLVAGRLRDYDGSLSIGGVELADVAEASLMGSVAYLGHQSHLFSGTVRDNLAMAAPDATDGELLAAAARAGIDGFLAAEQGLDTPVAEGGSNLSGGQRQRLALARALLADADVYLFDEATSNVDMESEDAIMAEVRRLAATKTVVLVSHRLATAAQADRIWVMEDGRLVEDGTHDELVAASGPYARLWDAQRSLETFGGEAA